METFGYEINAVDMDGVLVPGRAILDRVILSRASIRATIKDRPYNATVFRDFCVGWVRGGGGEGFEGLEHE